MFLKTLFIKKCQSPSFNPWSDKECSSIDFVKFFSTINVAYNKFSLFVNNHSSQKYTDLTSHRRKYDK